MKITLDKSVECQFGYYKNNNNNTNKQFLGSHFTLHKYLSNIAIFFLKKSNRGTQSACDRQWWTRSCEVQAKNKTPPFFLFFLTAFDLGTNQRISPGF